MRPALPSDSSRLTPAPRPPQSFSTRQLRAAAGEQPPARAAPARGRASRPSRPCSPSSAPVCASNPSRCRPVGVSPAFGVAGLSASLCPRLFPQRATRSAPHTHKFLHEFPEFMDKVQSCQAPGTLPCHTNSFQIPSHIKFMRFQRSHLFNAIR